MSRETTKTITIGNRVIGGGNPILIQSMCNTRTDDVAATVNQILELEKEVFPREDKKWSALKFYTKK